MFYPLPPKKSWLRLCYQHKSYHKDNPIFKPAHKRNSIKPSTTKSNLIKRNPTIHLAKFLRRPIPKRQTPHSPFPKTQRTSALADGCWRRFVDLAAAECIRPTFACNFATAVSGTVSDTQCACFDICSVGVNACRRRVSPMVEGKDTVNWFRSVSLLNEDRFDAENCGNSMIAEFVLSYFRWWNLNF